MKLPGNFTALQTFSAEFYIITDRVRSTREGNVLIRVCPSICLYTSRGVTPARSGGGVPHLGYPPSDLVGGTPARGYPSVRPGHGGTPARGTPPWVPPVRPDRVYPCQGVPHPGVTGVPQFGYPPIRPGQGAYPTSGTPPFDLAGEGGTPPRVEYLIRRGRYAFYVHAGGLSC